MRSLTALLLCASIVAAGCGGDDESEPPATPEQTVADLVNGFWTAIENGDDEVACPLMTDGGRRFLLRTARMAPGGRDIETCADAVATFADAWDERDEDLGGPGPADDGSFSAEQVWIDGDEAEASCKYRGAVMLERVDGEWLIAIPTCYD